MSDKKTGLKKFLTFESYARIIAFWFLFTIAFYTNVASKLIEFLNIDGAGILAAIIKAFPLTFVVALIMYYNFRSNQATKEHKEIHAEFTDKINNKLNSLQRDLLNHIRDQGKLEDKLTDRIQWLGERDKALAEGLLHIHNPNQDYGVVLSPGTINQLRDIIKKEVRV